MSIYITIKNDRIQAMKDKNTLAKGVLSALVGDLETMSKNLGQPEPTDEQVIKKIKTYISNAEFNLEHVSDAERTAELNSEIEILNAYLPKQLDEQTLRSTIKEVLESIDANGKQAIGQVMKVLKEKYSGQFDGKRASEIIREES